MQKKILILTLIMGLLGGGFFFFFHDQDHIHQYRILPHFMIASFKLNPMWQELYDRSRTKQPRIILISPDHFNVFSTNDQYYSGSLKSLCVRGDCVAIDGAFLPHDSSLLVSHIVDDMLVLVDHGLGSHFPFIKRYFPESTVVPLLVNPRSFQSFDLLLKQLHELQDERETIVIASVDWSHYVSEPWALLHDYSAWTLLVNPQRDKERWRKMDVDCPICLSLIDHLARKDGLYPQFRWRDSSGTIWGSTGVNMTSRMVISYEQSEQGGFLTGITLLLGGDGTALFESISQGDTNWKEYFYEWYQEHKTNNPLSGYYHRLGTSWDAVRIEGAEHAFDQVSPLGIAPFPDGDMIISDQHLSVSVLTNQSELSYFCSHITTPQPSIIVWKGYDRPVVDECTDYPIVLISLLSSGATSITQSGSMTHIALGPIQGSYMDSKQLVGVFIHHDGVQVYTP